MRSPDVVGSLLPSGDQLTAKTLFVWPWSDRGHRFGVSQDVRGGRGARVCVCAFVPVCVPVRMCAGVGLERAVQGCAGRVLSVRCATPEALDRGCTSLPWP